MRSKAFHALEQKLTYFNDDIELIDVLRLAIKEGDLTDSKSSYVLKHVTNEIHPCLSRRKNSEGSRELIVNHLRTTVYSSYVKDVYEEVTHYLKTILEQAARKGLDSGRLIGDHSFKINAKDILEKGRWDSVCKMITENVFQQLESERSTIKLLKNIAAKLALDVDEKFITAALPYLEIRHFLVHTDGKVSPEYKNKYPEITLQKHDRILLSYNFIIKLRDSVKDMMTEYDKKVISKGFLQNNDTMP